MPIMNKMATMITTTKLIKVLHDGKATFWTMAGFPLKNVTSHAKIIDKKPVQDNGYTIYKNELEEAYFGCNAQLKFFHPERHLYVLKDVWVTGSEGHLFFEPDTLFSVCSSLKGVKLKKIRRPIKSLAQIIEELVFILSGRAPGNRGHFLLEHLPRLVASLDIIQQFGGCKILVTPRHRKWQIDYLKKLDIPESDIIEASIGTVFCKKAFYVPMLCEEKAATMTYEKYYKYIRNKFIGDEKNIEKGLPVFLSRKDAPDRKLVNEDAIFFISKSYFPGMKRVTLSGLSLNEQIKLFQEAPVIIGPHSQPFRNLLFSSRSLSIQLIQGYRNASNEYYNWAQNYNYIGSIGGNLCLPLFNGIEFYKNSNWIYPEDKFKKDITRLVSLLEQKKGTFKLLPATVSDFGTTEC
ncbi:MAG: glycosyltransferase 61 family protein [Desulfobacterales bacterium]